jgi:hypothetical protein
MNPATMGLATKNYANTYLASMISVEIDPPTMNLATINNETIHTDGWT